MAGQAGTIVQDSQQQRRDPFAFRSHDLAGTVVKVQMPQTVDVLRLVAAHLARFEPFLSPAETWSVLAARKGLAHEAVALHVTQDGRIRRYRVAARICLDQNAQVVKVKLITPTLVRAILPFDHPAQIIVQRTLLPTVLAHAAAQDSDRIGLRRACGIVPALDGGDSET